ncbi:universal stress protein [Mycobacterium sp. BMJ-28]
MSSIIAGFSSSRQGRAPLYLAAQIARSTGARIIATAIVERSSPHRADPIDDEYFRYITAKAADSLEQVVADQPGDLDITIAVHQSTSIPSGLTELAAEHSAQLVVLGSSTSGLLGRVDLGAVTDRLVHTASVPVAIAPRGYPQQAIPITRLTAAFGGAAESVGLIAASAELCSTWSAHLRIASFTVRPLTMYGSALQCSAEDLVVEQWSRRTSDDIVSQLSTIRDHIDVPDVDIVVGSGHEWREAVDNISWRAGDVLVLGSGAAGQSAQVFLGSAASKILRHAPVPVMIVPRHASS